MTETVTHIAGCFICFQNGSFIQRCMICGEILISGNTNNIAIASTRKDEKFDVGRWGTGTLVRCNAGNDDSIRHSIRIGELPEDFKDSDLPHDFCLALAGEFL